MILARTGARSLHTAEGPKGELHQFCSSVLEYGHMDGQWIPRKKKNVIRASPNLLWGIGGASVNLLGSLWRSLPLSRIAPFPTRRASGSRNVVSDSWQETTASSNQVEGVWAFGRSGQDCLCIGKA